MHSWLIEHQQLFSVQIEKGILAHAILLGGVAGGGKISLANWLVEVILCQQPNKDDHSGILQPCKCCKTCLLYQKGNYPDLFTLATVSKNIGVDEIRRASHFLEKTAHLGNNKIVLLPKAEKMTLAAANALLKTLEEPSFSSILILVSDDLDMLLPTIISRCRLYDIRPLAGNALLQTLGQDEKNVFANVSQLPELTDDILNQQYHQFTSVLLGFINERQTRSQLELMLTDNQYGFRWLENTLVTMMRQQNHWMTGSLTGDSIKTSEHNLDADIVWQMYQLVVTCIKQLKSVIQVNAHYLTGKLLIDLERILDKSGG